MADDDYTGALETETRDLVALAKNGLLRPVLFRDKEIDLVSSALARRRSVLLVGDTGVGKSAVVHGLAQRQRNGHGPRLRELSTSQVLSGTRYLGEWQSKAEEIAKAAVRTGTALYFNDIWNLPSTGQTSTRESSLLDAYRPRIATGELQLLGKVTPETLDRLQGIPGFVTLFEQVRVAPLSRDEIDAILLAEAKQRGVTLDAPSRHRLLELTQRFLPRSNGPGPALRLLAQTCDYRQQKENVGEPEPASPSFIEKVFSIYSGLPRFVVSQTATQPAQELREWFRQRLLGQTAAIEAVIDTITLFKAGLNDPGRPIGTFFFAGPTGVGKTELARLLATFLFGSPRRMLRFDMSEFKDYHAFQMLVGDPDAPARPARLIDPIRANPFQVILFDELEKGHKNIWDLLLQLLDEGRLTPPRGQPVDCRNTIIIVTTNVGAAEGAGRSIGFSADTDHRARQRKMHEALETTFRPEFLNRFQHLVLFHPLSRHQVRTIARQELQRILAREGVASRKLIVDVPDVVVDYVVKVGFDQRYGARALKRKLQRLVVVPIATLVMERSPEPGSIVKVALRDGRVIASLIETAESRAHRREREPVKAANGKRYTHDEIIAATETIESAMAKLSQSVGESQLRDELRRLDQSRSGPGFHRDSKSATAAILETDRLVRTLSRLDQLHENVQTLKRSVSEAVTRRDFQRLTDAVLRADARISTAWRELVALGRDGEWDALLEIMPLTDKGPARSLLIDTYRNWALWRHMSFDLLREPLSDNEPVFVSIRGDYAYGLLRLEAGHHRVREKGDHSVVRVRVAPWTERTSEIQFVEQRALKMKGQLGGRIRSRVETEGGNLVLQNDRTLNENRELASQVAPSWDLAPEPSDGVIRRYDLRPFLVRDYLLDMTTGRPDALEPRHFHELLCNRVDVAASSATEKQ